MRSPAIVTPRQRRRPARFDDYITYGDDDLSLMEEVPSDDEEPPSPSDYHRQIFPRRNAVDKDFDVDKILARATEHGLDSYLVRWRPTIVEARQVQEGDHGEWTVEIDGVQYRDVEDVLGWEEGAVGSQKVTVVWRESWRSVWRLGKALRCIADYYKEYPDDDSLRKLQPRFWRSYQLDPLKLQLQMEAMSWAEVELNGRDFRPESVDYTKPILKLCNRLLRRKQQTWVRLLNMPVVRLLKFTEQWIERENFHIQRTANLRAMLVHCVGDLKENRCTSCAENDVPFRGCVVEDAEFIGTCTNCVVLGSLGETFCEWHFAFRPYERPEAVPTLRIADASGAEVTDDDATMEDQPDSTEKMPHFEIGSSQVDDDYMNEDYPGPSDGQPVGKFHENYEVPDSREPSPASSAEELYRLTPGLPVPERGAPGEGIANGGISKPSPISRRSTEANGLFVSPHRDSSENPLRTYGPSRSESILAFRPAPECYNTSTPAERGEAAAHPKSLNGDEATPGSRGWTAGKPPRDRTSWLKSQPVSPNPAAAPRIGEHRRCAESFTCLDPEIGCPEALNGPVLLYADHSFKRRGEATPAEVRFVLSRCNCGNAERLRGMFRDSISVRRQEGLEHEGLSFEQEMASTFLPELNETISMVCPPRLGFTNGEQIVID